MSLDFDRREYTPAVSDRLENMLDFMIGRVQPELKLTESERKTFVQNAAAALLKHSNGNVTKEFLFSEKFILNLHDQLKEAELLKKVKEFAKDEIANNANVTKDELKLKLAKHFTPDEMKRLDKVLEKAKLNEKFQPLFSMKLEPPKPGEKKKELSKEDELAERVKENLYGLRGNIPVVVHFFAGNPMIPYQGPIFETALNQISSRLITADPRGVGDTLGMKNIAADNLEKQSVDAKAVVDGIQTELNRLAPTRK